jgi:hypothetical protein
MLNHSPSGNIQKSYFPSFQCVANYSVHSVQLLASLSSSPVGIPASVLTLCTCAQCLGISPLGVGGGGCSLLPWFAPVAGGGMQLHLSVLSLPPVGMHASSFACLCTVLGLSPHVAGWCPQFTGGGWAHAPLLWWFCIMVVCQCCSGIVCLCTALWAFTPCGGLPAGHRWGALVPALGGCMTAVVAALHRCGALWPSWCCARLRCVGTFIPVQAVDGVAPLVSFIRRWWWRTIAAAVCCHGGALSLSRHCVLVCCAEAPIPM